jgi:2-hydroxy-6-oxonona-2,4-dienedioate hydrolase
MEKYTTKNLLGYNYIDQGNGCPIICLHGLMGGLGNFYKSIEFLSKKYRVIMPELPFYSLPIEDSTVENISLKFIEFLKCLVNEPVALIGNSIGGHIALITTTKHPELVNSLILTGSSGLYEKSFGETFPKRGNYDYVEKKSREVFYDPSSATKEIVDEVYEIVNNRDKAIRTLYIARSAINHNMKNVLGQIKQPVCLIWGKQDQVTPPEVAIELNQLLENSSLHWIDKCGHAAMMEQPDIFNSIVEKWMETRTNYAKK